VLKLGVLKVSHSIKVFFLDKIITNWFVTLKYFLLWILDVTKLIKNG